jgi:Spy/CpxP family protein refolding chaperone
MEKCFILFAALSFSIHSAAAQSQHSPYAGEHSRSVKALSDSEVRSYLSGAGMGFAKAAELNHYPGPLHVLHLASELQLSDTQRRQTQEVYDGMLHEARRLGEEVVERETELDKLFSSQTITSDDLELHTSSIARLQGLLRRTHLAAHLAMKKILTPEQVVRYDKLRGYTETPSPTDTRHQH